MSATYDYSVKPDVFKVRLITSDNDLTDVVFTDEEIEVFLDMESNDINLTAADVLEAWAAKYAPTADSEKIGDYSYNQKIVDKLLALATKLRTTASETPYLTWAEMDLTCGSGITAEED